MGQCITKPSSGLTESMIAECVVSPKVCCAEQVNNFTQFSVYTKFYQFPPLDGSVNNSSRLSTYAIWPTEISVKLEALFHGG